MAFDAYGKTDLPADRNFRRRALSLAYALAGFSNFFLRRPFVSDAVLAHGGADHAGGVRRFFNSQRRWKAWARVAQVNWNLLPAGILILFALWILAAVALACSTRFDTIPTLAICSAIFLVGLMSDYFFGLPAAKGSWWASMLYSVVPNWQLFWLADAIEHGQKHFSMGLRRQGVRLRGLLRRRGAGRGHGAV